MIFLNPQSISIFFVPISCFHTFNIGNLKIYKKLFFLEGSRAKLYAQITLYKAIRKTFISDIVPSQINLSYKTCMVNFK